MKINYQYSEATVRPLEIDTEASPDGVFLRKDIKELTRTHLGTEGTDETETYYAYQEAFLTKEEYALYTNVDGLTMTALDFIKVLKSMGVTSAELHTYLDKNPDLKDELTFCQNVYCGVVKALLPLTICEITITESMVEKAFKMKNEIE